jgi:hypothetical protein
LRIGIPMPGSGCSRAGDMATKQRLSKGALPIAFVASALWFLLVTTRSDAPREFVQAVAVGIAIYILLREGCRPVQQMQRPVPWRRR